MTSPDLYSRRIEAIARAMYAEHLLDVRDFVPLWESVSDKWRQRWFAQARAADKAVLEAIREPTETMTINGHAVDPRPGGSHGEWDCAHAEDIWTAMHAAIPRGET